MHRDGAAGGEGPALAPLTVMGITVEPCDGRELDRLVTALLNATGVALRVIDAVRSRGETDGEAIIDEAADCMSDLLARLAEHRSDEELALVTQVLAEITLLVGRPLGSRGCFEGGD
jgi:hypothetical protein